MSKEACENNDWRNVNLSYRLFSTVTWGNKGHFSTFL